MIKFEFTHSNITSPNFDKMNDEVMASHNDLLIIILLIYTVRQKQFSLKALLKQCNTFLIILCKILFFNYISAYLWTDVIHS